MSSLSKPPPPMKLCTILSETKRIILSHHRHFLALSLLFLLPLSFFSNVYLTLINHITSSSQFQRPHNTNASLFLQLIYEAVAILFSLLAAGAITFSSYNFFLGRPVTLVSSLLSLLRSFLPLLFTSLASTLIQLLIFFAFGLVLFLIIGFASIWQLTSQFIFLSCLIVGVLALLVIIYFAMNWALASVIVVVESSWGFEPLRRSTKLIKGMRGIPLSLMLFNVICSGFLMWGCSFFSKEFDGDFRSWKTWLFVMGTVVNTAVGMVLMLVSYVAMTVVYMHCKAVHGELTGQYVRLPLDDGKV